VYCYSRFYLWRFCIK